MRIDIKAEINGDFSFFFFYLKDDDAIYWDEEATK